METETTLNAAGLEGDQKIKEALKQSLSKDYAPDVAKEPRHFAWLGITLTLLILFVGLEYLFRFGYFDFLGKFTPFARRGVIGAVAILVVIGITRLFDFFYLRHLDDDVARFNLRRILRLTEGLVIGLIGISILFANWYTAVVSLGLISLVLGFALQTPVTSFIGWIYLLIRKPYRVGDRIRIGDASGDVIDVSYLDTTLWEFGGPYLSTDQPSGRIIKFPNSNVLDTPVFNYSWPLFPYIWNEISILVAYSSDLDFISKTMQSITEQDLGASMIKRVAAFRELLVRTPVDEVSVEERPSVFFRVSENTWIEATVRYLVEPRDAATVKSRLIVKMLAAINAAPDKVQFPQGDNR